MKRQSSYKCYLKDPNASQISIPKQTKYNVRHQNANIEYIEAKPKIIPSVSNLSIDNPDVETSSSSILPAPDDSSDSMSVINSDVESDDNDLDPEDELGEEQEEDKNDELNGTSTILDNHPIYQEAKITTEESAHLIFAYANRHKLSKVAVEDLLELIKLHIPDESAFINSVYNLRKVLNFNYSSVSTHFYCPSCKTYIGDTNLVCVKCNIDEKRIIENGSRFIAFDAKSSIQELLTTYSIRKNLDQNLKARTKRNPNALSSIVDGKKYKDLNLGPNDFTCIVNSDGVPIFKSSKLSMWPILCSISELDYSFRRKHIITIALWIGAEKPNFSGFFQPFINICKQLSIEGVDWKREGIPINSKVFFPIFVADSVARPAIQGLTQFNGRYGCTWCLAEGQSLTINKQGSHKWIYPFESKLNLRNKDQFVEFLKVFSGNLAKGNTQSSYFGIKTASKLLLVPKFDIIDSFVFDYMHTALLGVCRTFLNLWTCTSNYKEEYYIGNKIKEIDLKFMQCLVPSSFDRSVRSLTNRKFWKANEWRTWCFTIGHVLTGILKPTFLYHFLKFVKALMLLCSESVLLRDIDYAERLIVAFAQNIEPLYGKYYCNYNCHLMLHAAQCVRNWGPLHMYSAFQFEHHNGVLMHYFNGTQQIPIQMSRHVVEVLQANNRQTKFLYIPAKEFYLNMVQNCKKVTKFKILKNVKLLGTSKIYCFNDIQKIGLRQSGFHINLSALNFKACRIDSTFYNTISSITSKRCNCVVIANATYYIINDFYVLNEDIIVAQLSELEIKYIPTHPFMFTATKTQNDNVFVEVSKFENIKFVVVTDNFRNITHIVRIPNLTELE